MRQRQPWASKARRLRQRTLLALVWFVIEMALWSRLNQRLDVRAVDSTGKLDVLRSIGADHVIDYTQADFTKSGETYEVIFDVVGKSSFPRSLRSLKPNGRYLLANPRLSQMVRGRRILRRSGKEIIPYAAKAASEITEDLHFLTELLEAGKIQSIIDRCYPLEQTAQAHSYVETGHKKGNVVITVQ